MKTLMIEPAPVSTRTETLLELRGLRVEYGHGERPVRAVDGIDLRISPGEILGLAGESGCGKTTVASAVMQILRPPGHIVEGSIFFRGEEIVSVLNNRRPGERAIESPCASEAIIEIDDEWQTALILKRDGERYFVHVVGTEMSENQWVTGDRLRVAAVGHDGCASPIDWSFLGGAFGTGAGCGSARHSKPVSVDQEI